ncbi:hypothetical protein [Clostridium sp. OS1-26]|uniref:hypothetical protein n=1 Tax=Clostridium sp. OS1-26 TaxID=3070681 RepID=UPI0027E149F5|nr:hypothetical protein [Clostridium sp. OS1-26]WML35017.1 hypothetical protein RCG18_27890 [Clostridium sp. OS1-26]
MTDKLNNKDKASIADFASAFVSNPKIVENPADYVNYDEVHLTPLNDLLNDNNQINHKK